MSENFELRTVLRAEHVACPHCLCLFDERFSVLAYVSSCAAVHNPAVRRASFRGVDRHIQVAVVCVAILALLRLAVARVVFALPTNVALDFRLFLSLRIPALFFQTWASLGVDQRVAQLLL